MEDEARMEDGGWRTAALRYSQSSILYSRLWRSTGKYFSIVGAAPAVLDKAHDKEMNKLIKSVAAVE